MRIFPTAASLTLALTIPCFSLAQDGAAVNSPPEAPVRGQPSEDSGSPFAGMPLLLLMHNMQYYVHKLGLAVDAGNRPLADFYAHEVEEIITAVGAIDRHEGVAIKPIFETALPPAFAALERALDTGDAAQLGAAYDRLLEGCNACHRGAGRPQIVIRRSHLNPYPQEFTPVDAGAPIKTGP